MNLARPLKQLLDRLAGVRWAPLAATVDEVAFGAEQRLVAFAPDPFAALQREVVKTEPVAEVAAARRAARPQGKTAAALRGVMLAPPAASPQAHDLSDPPVADVPPWRPRPAAPGLPQRVPTPWPALPKERSAAGVPALEAVAVQALVARFAAANDVPALDALRLRALATPRPPAATSTSAPAAAAPQRQAAQPAAVQPVPRRPLPDRAAEVPAAAAPVASAASLPSPRGRTSALAELLQRWPGAKAAADAPAVSASPATSPAAEFAPMPSAAGTPLSAADLPAAFGSDLPRPQPLPDDLQFTRTLERVLMAEVRRQGLEPDVP